MPSLFKKMRSPWPHFGIRYPKSGDYIVALQHISRLAGAAAFRPLSAYLDETMSQPIFHAPDHDHERCTADALHHAECRCAERSQRLTPIRRRVLEVLLQSHKPLGAYEIIEQS